MKVSQILNKMAKNGVKNGVITLPQASITPIVLSISIVLGEGTSLGQDDQPSPSSQVPAIASKPTYEWVVIQNVESNLKKMTNPFPLLQTRRRKIPCRDKPSPNKLSEKQYWNRCPVPLKVSNILRHMLMNLKAKRWISSKHRVMMCM